MLHFPLWKNNAFFLDSQLYCLMSFWAELWDTQLVSSAWPPTWLLLHLAWDEGLNCFQVSTWDCWSVSPAVQCASGWSKGCMGGKGQIPARTDNCAAGLPNQRWRAGSRFLINSVSNLESLLICLKTKCYNGPCFTQVLAMKASSRCQQAAWHWYIRPMRRFYIYLQSWCNI